MVQAAIETMLRQKIGLDANSIGSRTIARAVEQRRLACGLPDKTSYLHRLQTSAQELEELIETVVVPETWFFRDKEPFIYLSQYVKTEWVKANWGILRVLSVPCSTGEEPLSIAMTLLDSGLAPNQFGIDAVDISKRALLKAKQAIYSKRAFRGGDGLGAKQRYFEEVGDKYHVRPIVRERVKFIQGNLLKPEFLFHKYHIIFCRNLLIYLDYAARNQALQALDRALAPSGLLFMGAAETAQITAKNYTPIRHPSAFVYRKENRVEVPVKSLMIASAAIVKAPDTKSPPNPQPAQPISPSSQLEMAKHLANRGQLAEAALLCESYLSANRTDAQAYILVGEIYQGLNRLDIAEQSFQKAVYLKPHAIDALIHLALIKEQQGDRARADILRQRVQRLLTIQNRGFNNGSSDVE
jgi:chemotaxis protein methyltransferase WspC